MRKLRASYLLLALILFGNSICSVPAFAAGRQDTSVKQAEAGAKSDSDTNGDAGADSESGAKNEKTVITEIEITDVDGPAVGKRLASEATVRAYKDGKDIGVSWKIPVLWVDESGKTAEKAENGRIYIPFFVFFVPDGYELQGVDFARLLNVKLPEFVSALYAKRNLNTDTDIKESSTVYFNTNGILSAFDPVTGITYIKGNAVLPSYTNEVRGKISNALNWIITPGSGIVPGIGINAGSVTVPGMGINAGGVTVPVSGINAGSGMVPGSGIDAGGAIVPGSETNTGCNINLGRWLRDFGA